MRVLLGAAQMRTLPMEFAAVATDLRTGELAAVAQAWSGLQAPKRLARSAH